MKSFIKFVYLYFRSELFRNYLENYKEDKYFDWILEKVLIDELKKQGILKI